MSGLTSHPYADKFPMLPEGELAELAESIAANGLRQPIVVTLDGLILDGRNRYAACEIACVEPETVVYDGDDLAEYVIDCNVTRRNMSTGARAMATALVLAEAGRRDDGRWAQGAIEFNGSVKPTSWQQRMNECGVILDFTPDAAESVVNGDVALDAAYRNADQIRRSAESDKVRERELKKRRKQEAEAEAQRSAQIVADLTDAGATKYLEWIDAGDMTPPAAWSAYREETRKERERLDAERKARSDLYSGIARGLQIVGSYGKYDDYGALMTEYNPGELNPPQYAREFDVENLKAAAAFVQWLISDWSGK